MNKMVSLILLVIFTSLLFGANAQTESDLLGVFADKALKLQGKKLRYREVLTAPQDTAQPILVIYLHGGSGGGSDNKKQMMSPAVGKIYDYLNGRQRFMERRCATTAQSWRSPIAW